MPLAHVLTVGGESQACGVPAHPHRVEPLANGDVQRPATARYDDEHSIDGVRESGTLLVGSRTAAALEASRRPGDLVKVPAATRNRRVIYAATLAKGSDIPRRGAGLICAAHN
jgi:hypothetical protein